MTKKKRHCHRRRSQSLSLSRCNHGHWLSLVCLFMLSLWLATTSSSSAAAASLSLSRKSESMSRQEEEEDRQQASTKSRSLQQYLDDMQNFDINNWNITTGTANNNDDGTDAITNHNSNDTLLWNTSGTIAGGTNITSTGTSIHNFTTPNMTNFTTATNITTIATSILANTTSITTTTTAESVLAFIHNISENHSNTTNYYYYNTINDTTATTTTNDTTATTTTTTTTTPPPPPPPPPPTCYNNTLDVYWALWDSSRLFQTKRIVLCSNTTFDLGFMNPNTARFENGQIPLLPRSNTIISCNDTCILRGGDFGIMTLPYLFYDDISVTNVIVENLIFERNEINSVYMDLPGNNIQFVNCLFRDNQNEGVVRLHNVGLRERRRGQQQEQTNQYNDGINNTTKANDDSSNITTTTTTTTHIDRTTMEDKTTINTQHSNNNNINMAHKNDVNDDDIINDIIDWSAVYDYLVYMNTFDDDDNVQEDDMHTKNNDFYHDEDFLNITNATTGTSSSRQQQPQQENRRLIDDDNDGDFSRRHYLIVTFRNCQFYNNHQAEPQPDGDLYLQYGLITLLDPLMEVTIENCEFLENNFGNDTIAPYGYAVRSDGASVTLNSNCFIDNDFFGPGTIIMNPRVDGAATSINIESNNNFGTLDDDLFCMFIARFLSIEDYQNVSPTDCLDFEVNGNDDDVCLPGSSTSTSNVINGDGDSISDGSSNGVNSGDSNNNDALTNNDNSLATNSSSAPANDGQFGTLVVLLLPLFVNIILLLL